MSFPARRRRHFAGGQSASSHRNVERCAQLRSVVHHRERPGARSALQVQARRHARRRRARPVRYQRARRPRRERQRERLQHQAARLRARAEQQQRDLPDSDAGLRRRPHRGDSGQHDPRQHERQQLHEEEPGHFGTPEPQRERRHHLPVRLEGAERLAGCLFLGEAYNVEERGITQRAVPDRARPQTRGLPAARSCPTTCKTRRPSSSPG